MRGVGLAPGSSKTRQDGKAIGADLEAIRVVLQLAEEYFELAVKPDL